MEDKNIKKHRSKKIYKSRINTEYTECWVYVCSVWGYNVNSEYKVFQQVSSLMACG